MAQSDDTVDRATAFDRIVCAIDPLAPSTEAAHQAVMLAGPSAELTFLAVMEKRRGEDQAEAAEVALEAAAKLASERGVPVATRKITSENAQEGLIDSSEGADLLVVGAGARDVLIGGTASAAVHAAPLPVLVARGASERRAFPELILVATDGSPEARRGIGLALRIADAQRSRVALIQVVDGGLATGGTLAEDAAAVSAAAGRRARDTRGVRRSRRAHLRGRPAGGRVTTRDRKPWARPGPCARQRGRARRARSAVLRARA